MKVLITTDWYATATNGVVTSVKNLSEELTGLGHEVRILTLSGDLHSHAEGPVYYIRSAPLRVYPGARVPLSPRPRLVRELIDWGPDIIHSQCEFFSFEYARRIARLTGAPLVHTYHTLYEEYTSYVTRSKRVGRYVAREFSRRRLRLAARIIVPTRKTELVLEGYGIRNGVCVIPSGIALDRHRLRITQEERSTRRSGLGIGEDRLVLLNLGRLGTEKNIGELLRYFAAALTGREGLMFLIVGDGPAREELHALASELGILDHVIFTGMVPQNEVQAYYQMGDIFVSASTSESQGLTYVEAAANGLPLLCRRDACLEEVVLPGENGYTYEDMPEFLERLDRLLSSPEFRSAAGRRSEEISRRYDKSRRSG